MNVLRARQLQVALGSRIVLDGVDLELRPGEVVLLAGRNGAGKSTLLRALLAAVRPRAGSIDLGDKPLGNWQAMARAREIAFVPQDVETPFEFTGRELVAMGRHPHRGLREALQESDQRAIDEALTAVDAHAFARRAVTTLSGGEQRRIAVARALATQAPLMLLDEPTSNLDLEHALQLVQLLRRSAANGHGVLIASHDLNLLAPHCTRVVLLHEARVFVDAAPEIALNETNLEAVFGVRSAAVSGYFPREFRLRS